MIELVSKTLLRRLLLTVLLAGTLFGERAALADVVLDPLDQAVWPLIPLAPLGPITSAGRISRYCQPEHAARSRRWQGAGLPTGVGKP
jgi:hypothetical protein